MIFKKESLVINGRTFFYWQARETKKETVIVLHGFPGNHKGIMDFARRLDKKYRIIVPDLPACGESDTLGDHHNLDEYSNWLNTFLTLLSVHKVIIVGHSFGARLALVFYEKYSGSVARLILITPVVKVVGLIVRIIAIEYKIADLLPDALKKLWLEYDFHRQIGYAVMFKSASHKRRQEIMEKDMSEFSRLDPKINIELFHELHKLELIPADNKIVIPSLVIAGELDEIAPLESIREFSKSFENNTFIVIKKAGHLVPLEKPMTVAHIINLWLT